MMFKKEKMSDMEKKSKLSVLKDLHKQASDAMKGDLQGMKKVTVAADSKSGLKEGLDKAEEMLGMEGEDEESELGEKRAYDEADESKEDQSEGFEDQQDESEPMDEEELDAKIQELLKLKEKLQK